MEVKMKLSKLLSFILLLVLLTENCFSQDTNIVKYLPLKVGNVWVYNWLYYGNPVSGGIAHFKINHDTVINAHKYFVVTFPTISQSLLRVDSLNGNIYYYGGGCVYHPGETLIDSLKSKKLDTVNFCNSVKRYCQDTGNVILFGNQYQRKVFWPYMILSAINRSYAKNIGIYFTEEGDYFVTRYSLKGCVLNGVVYGDTSMPVGIIFISSETPKEFILYQNYPNPFNSTTKIKFDIPQSVILRSGATKNPFITLKIFDVLLKIFDVLGNEITTLVNENLNPGSYEVEWDGTNYPSGIYYYRIAIHSDKPVAGDYIETKKLVLIK
jgi:hypothetical protein